MIHVMKPFHGICGYLLWALVAIGLNNAPETRAAVPGITGTAFNLTAQSAFISQPDGQTVYSWGYGCTTSPGASDFLPSGIPGSCSTMQIPGPTIIVTEGQTFKVTLHNNLPAAAGNTSILFPGLQVTATGGAAGTLTQEATHESNGDVTYTVVASTAGTHTYYSGTQGDIQVEMGLYGAIIVQPGTPSNACRDLGTLVQTQASANGEKDYRLAKSAYSHDSTCYDREYLVQTSEMDPRIHRQVEEQVGLACTKPTGCLNVATEPYHPAYYLLNGRSFPDVLDPSYAVQYPHQPYNSNPHMHPGELVLVRFVGNGHWQHPFHEHANHMRVLARDGNLLLSKTDSNKLAGPLTITNTTTPGQTIDEIFYWTGKGLNWDVFGHTPNDGSVCVPDANGYNTQDPGATNYYEWCQDHNKPLESRPFGSVGSGGPMTLPDPNLLATGPWYGGSAYLGPEATQRAVGFTPISPAGTVANSPGEEAGFAFMWHSHNEREITTNNIFPGGMMTMMLVDPYTFPIDESK